MMWHWVFDDVTLYVLLCDIAYLMMWHCMLWHCTFNVDIVCLMIWHCIFDVVTLYIILWHCTCNVDIVYLMLWHCIFDDVTLYIWWCDTVCGRYSSNWCNEHFIHAKAMRKVGLCNITSTVCLHPSTLRVSVCMRECMCMCMFVYTCNLTHYTPTYLHAQICMYTKHKHFHITWMRVLCGSVGSMFWVMWCDWCEVC